MENKMIISPAPHVHGPNKTQRLMLDVLIALVPALVVSTVVYGLRVLALTLFSVCCCLLFEWFIQRYMLRGKLTINNLSAVVTGVLMAFNLPVNIPLWMVAIGALVAIGVAKMTFGGLGKNIFNPALVGRVFMLIAFPVAMTTFPEAADAISGATPLTMAKEALKNGVPVAEVMQNVSIKDMFIGVESGSIGEISAVALLLGGLYLLWRRVITWHIPVAVLGSMGIFSLITWLIAPEAYMSPLFHLMGGGAMLGAWFMATDYVTSPMTPKGSIIFGVGVGVITMLVRLWGAYPEGMSFAILIMNSVVPLLDKYILPKRFGAPAKK
ncbi:MAG: RnfABCDGE type electron transport complex subunit D [Tidjanibacter sp.]|nr:RnfABCDGE type electron transport complex subunit D [Tidjanibacter sp.]